jgi:SAM-dependent methyltransferase
MNLGDRDSRRIREFYGEAFARHGVDPKSLHWINSYNQRRRFEVLAAAGDLRGASILDVGCGLGDFLEFLKERGIDADYTGIDIVPQFIEAARSRFPDGKFLLENILEMVGEFDYVLASGAMSFRVEDNENYYFEVIKRMFDLSRRAAAFNMLDRRAHEETDIYAVYDPREIALFCETIARRIDVAIDYMPDDFTVYMYK